MPKQTKKRPAVRPRRAEAIPTPWYSTAKRVALLVGACGVPLFFLRVGSDPFNVPKLGLLAFVLGVGLACRILEAATGRDARGLAGSWLPGVLVLAPLALGWLFSPYKGWALLGHYGRFQGLLPYVLVVVLGLLVAEEFRDRPSDLAFWGAVSGGVVGAYAVIQAVGLDPFDWARYGAATNEALTTLGNSNFTGGFLAVTLPLAIATASVDGSRRKVAQRLLALIVVGLILSFSQGGWAAAIAGAAVTVGLAFRRKWSSPTLGGVVAGAIATVIVGAVIAGAVLPEQERIPGTVRERSGWWVASTNMALANPAGRGPNTFRIEGVSYRSAEAAVGHGFDFSDDPHSVFLSFLTGAGFLGGLGFVAMGAWTLARSWRPSVGNVLLAGFAGAAVAYFVQALVSIDELSLRVAFWGIALAGVLATAATVEPDRKKPRKPRPVPSWAWGAALLPLVAGGWAFVGFLASDAAARHAVTNAIQGDVDGAVAELENALAFRDEYEYRRQVGFRLGLSVQAEGVDGVALVPEVNAMYAYLDDFEDPFALVDHARFLAAMGEHDPTLLESAAERYQEASELDEKNPVLATETFDVLVLLERYEEAADVARRNAEELADLTPASIWGSLALAEARLGDIEEARAALARAEALDPSAYRAKEARAVLATLDS